jgi:Kae1-associated kinase Bud32
MAAATPHAPGEQIYQGAEALLTTSMFFGRLSVEKRRKPKAYRLAQLEHQIARGRMRNEARLMRRAREAGVAVPALLDAEPESQSLVLEYLGRSSLRSVFDSMSAGKRRSAAEAIGGAIARLHAASVIHGDLTTSNMIMRDGRVHLIDFSLGHISETVEDRAVDLKAFKDSFVSTHVDHASDLSFVLAGYRKGLGESAQQVIKQIASIEGRRRYA